MIDSHAHLLYFNNQTEIIKSLKNDGVNAVVTIGTTVEDSKASIEFAKLYDNIYASVGIYPEYASDVDEQDLIEIEKIAKSEKVVAIGEIGLDYHTAGYDREKQK